MAPTGSNKRTARTNSYHHRSHRRIKAWKNQKFKLREIYGAKKLQSHLSTAFLNVDGLSDAKLADVVSYAEQCSPDIIFLLETKRRLEEVGSDINIEGYDISEIRRSDTAGDKQGGGIACYTKNTRDIVFKSHTPQIEHEDLAYVENERFWITVESQFTKTAVCGLYFGCQFSDDRNKEWNEGMFWVLQQEVQSLRDQGYRVLLVGDFNAHIGNIEGQGVVGNNPDINKNGQRFLDFLMNYDLTHVNGAMNQDDSAKICSGVWSRQRGSSRSLIDYAVISSEHLSSVQSMFVDENGIYGGGSDHNWSEIIVFDKIARLVKVDSRPKKKNVWNIREDQDWSAFQRSVSNNLASLDCTNMSEDELAARVASVYNTAGRSTLGYKQEKRKRSHVKNFLPAHITDALKLKRSLARTWKSLSSSGSATQAEISEAERQYTDQSALVDGLFQCYHSFKRSLKWGNRNKKSKKDLKDFWSSVTGKVIEPSVIRSVLSEDGVLVTDQDRIIEMVEKHLCKVFKGSMEPLDPAPCDPAPPDHGYADTDSTPANDLDHPYSTKQSPKLPKIDNSDSLERNPSNWLDRDFSTDEIRKIAAKLVNGKAKGWDNIPPEFIKNSPSEMFDVLTLLFNKIKNSGNFPSGWNCGRITLIHKKGLRAKLGNYRPLTVIIALSGFYSKLLNERLVEVVESFSLLGEVQNGFRKTRDGSDNIFILNTALWKAKALSEKIHLGFVDITKAYDSVDRNILWRKLKTIGINGLFLDTIKSMYTGDSVRCTVNGLTTRSVYLQRGLRQGCSLSPMLFALYIMDIGEDIVDSQEGIMIGDVFVSGLLFADDIVLISRTTDGLKRLFKTVKQRCDQLLLDINTGEGKTEVVSPTDQIWDIFSEDVVELSLRQVVEYSYLGLETSASILRTTIAKQAKCLKVANKYKFACLHIGKSGPDIVDAALASWNQVALPSILYGCESIVFSETTILGLERIQAEIAKNILGLSSNTANICAQSELGILPFRFSLYRSQLRFYFRVLYLPDGHWVKKALLEHLSLAWPSPYLKNIISIREKVQLPFVPPTLRYLGTHLYQWSLSQTNSVVSQLHLPHVGTLSKYCRQPYVFEHPHLPTIAQFRLSNAGLGNRRPRFAGVLYERQKFCPLCSTTVLTEAHVIFFCSSIEHHRKKFNLHLYRTACQLKGLDAEQTLTEYINSYDWEKVNHRSECVSLGHALDTLRGHWLSLW